MRLLIAVVVVSATAPLLSRPLPAPPPTAHPPTVQKSEAEIRADIEFAKGLAEMGFVDLSQQVIVNLESGGLPAKLGEQVALLKCEAFFAAAKNDPTNRQALLKKAMEAYQGFIDRNAYSELKDQADAGLVEVASYYVRTLALSAEDAAGEQKKQLHAEMSKVIEAAVGRVNDLLGRMPSNELSEADRRRRNDLLLTSGELTLEWAKIQDVGTANFQRSRDAFTKLSDENIEGTPWSLRAFIGIGDNYVAQANAQTDYKEARQLYREASSYYEFAVNFSIARDLAAWKAAAVEMTQEEKQSRFLFVQMGTPGLIRSLVAAGDAGEANAWGLHYYNTWKREGLDLVQPLGHLALLEVARTLIDAGGYIGGNSAAGEAVWYATLEELAAANVPKSRQMTSLDFALSLAQKVADDNKGNNLQVRAQKVIGEIIARPGIKVDPNVLFEAARGDFNESEWSRAIDSMKRVVVALEAQDQATRQEMMPKVLWHIGRSYQRMDRTLEAASVFEHAVDQWSGDPEYDQFSAKGFYDSAQQLKRAIKNDAAIDALQARADEAVRRISTNTSSGEDIKFRDAEKLADKKEYEAARAMYASIAGGDNLEKAMVAVGVSDYRLSRYEEAIKVFDRYLNQYLNSGESSTVDPKRLLKRQEARATATYFWGLAVYELADSGKGEWKAVVDVLEGYPEKFPEQTQFAPAGMYRVLYAQARMGQQAQVKEKLAKMLQLYPDNAWTGRAATESYRILKLAYEAETDPAKKSALLRQMAENLQVVNKTSAKPSFPNLRTESKHWEDLQEPAIAEEVLQRILTQFKDDPSVAEDIEKFVKPALGAVLLAQDKAQEATAVLKPLMDPKATVRANRETAYNFGISVTGWPTFDETSKTIREHAGSGANAKDFEPALESINQLLSSAEKWTSTEWYRYKAAQVYGYLRWAQFDGNRLDSAKNQMSPVTVQLGPQQYKHEAIPEDLRQIFLWLAGKLR